MKFNTRQEAIDYYKSIDSYNFYFDGFAGNKDNLILTEVKDNVVEYNNEYYVTGPTSKYEDVFTKNSYEDGIYWVHIVKHNYRPSTFFVNSNVILDQAYKFKVVFDEIYAKTYGTPVKITYTASYRDGLSIYFSELIFDEFITHHFCKERWGYNCQFIFLTKDFIEYLKNECYEKLVSMCHSGVYAGDIDDSESYGEYSFNYVKFKDDSTKQIFGLIEKVADSYIGDKYRNPILTTDIRGIKHEFI